jgi:hypothetical protein
MFERFIMSPGFYYREILKKLLTTKLSLKKLSGKFVKLTRGGNFVDEDHKKRSQNYLINDYLNFLQLLMSLNNYKIFKTLNKFFKKSFLFSFRSYDTITKRHPKKSHNVAAKFRKFCQPQQNFISLDL